MNWTLLYSPNSYITRWRIRGQNMLTQCLQHSYFSKILNLPIFRKKLRSWGSRVVQEALKVQNTETCKVFLRVVVHFSDRTGNDFPINYSKKPDWISAIMDVNTSYFIVNIPLKIHAIDLWNETDIDFLYYGWWDPWKETLI